MSVWNPDNIRDVAESVGIAGLGDEVLGAISSDVEYRVSQVLDESFRSLRQGKRSMMRTRDVAVALRALDVEPLYGYDSTRPLRFGEASIGPGQPLFYVEDEEVDFEKLINAPLPKVPRESSFTAHWLAVDGVQPLIPQNPTNADARNLDLLPKSAAANPHLAAISDTPSNNPNAVTVKPQVKHILSQELQLYFEKVTSALLDETNDEYRNAALASLRTDPGLHQLVPYFVQFIAEKVTHSLKDIFILTQIMHLTSAMLDNKTLHLDPYISSLIPPILTTLLSPSLGPGGLSMAHYPLRLLSSSIIASICATHAKTSSSLKPRLARTCLKAYLSPSQPLRVHYGALLGLQATGGREVIRALVLPNVREYGDLVLKAADESEEPVRKADAEMMLKALLQMLAGLVQDEQAHLTNGFAGGHGADEEWERRAKEKLGDFVGEKVCRMGRMDLVKALVRSIEEETTMFDGFRDREE